LEKFAVEMRNITKIFGNLKANDAVDFKLRENSINGLLGENGAGKTTLMNVLYGLYRQEEGEIYIHGQKTDIVSPLKAISSGIGMVHQHFMLARPLTVVENIMLGRKSSRGIFLDTRKVAAEIRELSDRYHLMVDPYARIWQLSVGQQQRVEILTTIYQGANILILDEPTAVLTPQEAETLFSILRQMRDDGKSMILITHKLEEILSVVDDVTILRDGKMISSFKVTPATTKEELSRLMVGRDVLFDFNPAAVKPGKERLGMKDLRVKNDKGLPAVNNFSLSVSEGEIVGLAGVDGNGQKELAEALTGLRPAEGGKIFINGIEAENKPPVFFIHQGVAHIPEDRQNMGLAMGFCVSKNLIIKRFCQQPYAKNGVMNYKNIKNHAQKMIQDFQIKTNTTEDITRDLSGGNQQKVILARELADEPSVLIANQPTRGLDVGATEYVRSRLLEARSKGAAILLISADIEEIIQLSDRIAVIYNGELMGILPKGSQPETIGLLMMGKRQGENTGVKENQ